MINEFEFFHGLVFARILHATSRPISVEKFRLDSNASYVLDGTIGLYIKHSAKRMTPWKFTFKKEHKNEIDLLSVKFKNVFIILVCNNDGIACISYSELNRILNNQCDPIEWISVNRHKREMYSIKGSNGELDYKIGLNDFPGKIFKI